MALAHFPTAVPTNGTGEDHSKSKLRNSASQENAKESLVSGQAKSSENFTFCSEAHISTFIKRLKEARLAAGLSQKKLGILAGIDEFSASARVNQYETGKHSPDAATTAALCKVLRVPVAYLYCDDDELAKVLAQYTHLSEKAQQEFLKVAEKTVGYLKE